jgi:1,4-beta-D-xylan synthase
MEGMLSPAAAAGNDGLADPLLVAIGDGTGRTGASSKDKKRYWVPVDDEEDVLAAEEDGGKDCRRPLLYRTFKVKGILLQTYRYVMGLILLVVLR